MGHVLKQIAELEDEVKEILQQAQDASAPLDKQLASEVQKLGERRFALVSGKSHPEPSELEGLDDAEALAAATGGASAAAGSSVKGSVKGVPYFWVSVLSNCDAVSEHISGRDRLALEYLRDVRRVAGRVAGVNGVELVFDAKNPYFTNKVLRRTVGEGVDEGTDIDWKEGMNLTVKEVTKKKKAKKGKKGGGGDGAGADAVHTHTKPCPSFFRFFEAADQGGALAHLERMMAPEIEEVEEEHEEDEQAARAEAKLASDSELLDALLLQVMLRATHLYIEGPLQGSGGTAARGASSEEEDDFEMVAGGSGTVEDLPPQTRAVVAALGAVQRKMDEAVARHRAERRKVAGDVAEKLRAMYGKRRALLVGTGAPRCYLLRVLRSMDTAALAITPRDAAVLQHLVDVRFEIQQQQTEGSGGGGSGSGSSQEVHGTLELEFAEDCPQLAGSKTLKKSYSLLSGGGGSVRLLSSKVVAPPQWAPGVRDPTHRKARDGRLRPCASFFQLFKPGGGGGKLAFNLTGPEKEVQSEANELELELLQELRTRVLPQTAAIYSEMPGADDVASEGDEEESEEEEGEEDGSGDSEDEAAAARRAALKHKKAAEAQPWWRISQGTILLFLLLLVLIAPYLAFFIR